MTRALAESILDPFLIINGLTKKQDTNLNVILAVSYAIIVIFCNCVYNEVLIVYCCRLEKNTFVEITKRAEKDKNSKQTI